MASLSYFKHKDDIVCSASQVVELVFNNTSQQYEYWKVYDDATQVKQSPPASNTLKYKDNINGNEDDSITIPVAAQQQEDDEEGSTYYLQRPPNPSDYFFPKISAGRFLLCSCQHRQHKVEVVCPLRTSICVLPSNGIDNNQNYDHPLPAESTTKATTTTSRTPLPPSGSSNLVTTTDSQCILLPDSKNETLQIVTNTYLWPFIIMCYAVLGLALFVSRIGRQTIMCCLGCIPCLNNKLASIIINNERRSHEEQSSQQPSEVMNETVSRADLPIEIPEHEHFFIGCMLEKALYLFGSVDNNNIMNRVDEEIQFQTRNTTLRPSIRQNNRKQNGVTARQLLLKTTIYRRPEDVAERITTPQSSDGRDIESSTPQDSDFGLDIPVCGRCSSSSSSASASYDDDNDEEEEDCSCPICFVRFSDGDRVGKLACKHIFHVECIKSWIKAGNRDECPLCRNAMLIPKQKSSEI
jgi:hypothetical protein